MNCDVPSILRALLVKGTEKHKLLDARHQHVELRRGSDHLEQQHEHSSIVERAARHSSSEKTLQDTSCSELKNRV